MKKIFFILTILNFIIKPAVALNGEDLRTACENLPVEPSLVFYTSYGKLKYDTSYTRDKLTQLGKNLGMFEEGDLASGLALVDVASEYELNTSSRKMVNGAYCIIPAEISVYIGFQNPVIYLAKDLKTGSCRYNLVVRHEKIHQQINVNALEYFIPLIFERVKEIVAKMRPMYVIEEKNIKHGTAEMTTFYAEQINALVEEFKQEILAEQRKLDNREQYRLESNICHRYEEKNQH